MTYAFTFAAAAIGAAFAAGLRVGHPEFPILAGVSVLAQLITLGCAHHAGWSAIFEEDLEP